MKGSTFTEWMTNGFRYTQAVLLQEIIKPRAYVSEELVRTSLVHGLVQSKPSEAHRIGVEGRVSWNANQCWIDPSHGSPGRGRAIQHDLVIEADNDMGAVCEVKWLKAQKATEVAKDIWKLALSRSTSAERKAVRSFMLIGGERRQLGETLRYLKKNGGLALNWSRRGGKRALLPNPTTLDLDGFRSTHIGEKALLDLLAWGKHYRTPPACFAALRISPRCSWELTVNSHGWALALMEFHMHGVAPGKIAWATTRSQISPNC